MPTKETIWKFPLPLNRIDNSHATFKLGVTRHAQILRVDIQQPHGLQAWVRLDPMQRPLNLDIAIVGTGEQIPDDFDKFINTFFSDGFVFHAFTKEML